MSVEPVFKEIPNYPGYLAGSDGGIYSIKTWGFGNGRRSSGLRRLSTKRTNRDGYPVVQLSLGGRNKVRQVHTLVATAFHARPPDLQCRHLDGDRTNSQPDNLAWGTAKENAADRDAHGRTALGGGVRKTILTPETVREIRLERQHKSQDRVARKFGVSQSTISMIDRGLTWSHIQ